MLFDPSRIFTVTEINSIIKEILRGTFPDITVEGEISNLKTSSAGHTYFDLKDQNSLISAVFFKGYAGYSTAEIREGLLVRIRGELDCYTRQGRYQLIVKSMETKSAGALFIAFEKLKKKLASEGLFDENRKKPVPAFPKKIGVVTSPTGAAVRDIISVLRRRNSTLEVLIAPVAVQGDAAKHEISEAIEALNLNFPDLDVMLVGRGGGSVEDLWAFNEEIVARAISASKIPVISCVGHETDFTIADFVADLRAPTPSAAAEIVSRHRDDTLEHLGQLKSRLLQSLSLFYERLAARYAALAGSPVFRKPELLWRDRELELDRLQESVIRLSDARVSAAQERLGFFAGKLSALNPTGVLKRGYSIARRKFDGSIISDSAATSKGDLIELQFHSGTADCEILQTRGKK